MFQLSEALTWSLYYMCPIFYCCFTIASWPTSDPAQSAFPQYPPCANTSAPFSMSGFATASWPPVNAAWSAFHSVLPVHLHLPLFL